MTFAFNATDLNSPISWFLTCNLHHVGSSIDEVIQETLSSFSFEYHWSLDLVLDDPHNIYNKLFSILITLCLTLLINSHCNFFLSFLFSSPLSLQFQPLTTDDNRSKHNNQHNDHNECWATFCGVTSRRRRLWTMVLQAKTDELSSQSLGGRQRDGQTDRQSTLSGRTTSSWVANCSTDDPRWKVS